MSFVPHTEADRQEMLQTIGISSIKNLFGDVPLTLQSSPLPELKPLSESEILSEVLSVSGNPVQASFLGAGSYNHYIPSVVKHLAGRSEFYTAYTPYQPEISQGTLIAIYEYQSMICELTGMDITNASMYDGASAAAEAALLACSFTKKKELVFANLINPNYKRVINTYVKPRDINFAEKISATTAAVIIALPDFHGVIEDYRAIIEAAHKAGALAIVIADPHLLSVLEAPGNLGADIVVGEGQSLGIPQSFGGPGLGFFAAKSQFLRYMPGRIIGKTNDIDGKPAYVLTMQTREQHIRREKATSNICSNEALCALMATIYLSVMGPEGLQLVAKLSKKRADHAKKVLSKIKGFKVSAGDTYKEFVLECPSEVKDINKRLYAQGIIGGLDLGNKKMLVCCTELTTEKQIDLFAEGLARA